MTEPRHGAWELESREIALACDAAGIVTWADARAERRILARPGLALAALALPGLEAKVEALLSRAREGRVRGSEIPLVVEGRVETWAFSAWPDGRGGTALLGAAVPEELESLVRQLREAMDEVIALNRKIAREKRLGEEEGHRRRRAEEALRRAVEADAARLARLQAFTAALSHARTTQDVAAVLALHVHDALGVASLVVYALEAGDSLRLIAAMGIAAEYRTRLERMPIDAAIPVAAAVRLGVAQWLPTSAAIAEGFPGAAEIAPHLRRLGAVAALPLRAGGEILGAVAFGFTEQRPLEREERALIEAIAQECAEAMARARLLDIALEAREAEARVRAELEAIFDNAPLGLAVFDTDFRFVRVNPRMAEVNGVPAAAHPGRTMRELLPELPLDKIEADCRRVLETGQPVVEAPVSGKTPSDPGRTRHWLSSYFRIATSGRVLGIGALVREVTAEREAEEFQRNVIGIVGHDLRNPLSAVATSAALLARRGGLSPEQARLVERVGAGAQRMGSILSLLLDYARVRVGERLPLRRRACALDAVCRGVVSECASSFPGREITERYEGDLAGWWDEDRIAQVVTNLLRNALTHGAPDAPVEIACRDGGAHVFITVRNRGSIPPDLLPHVFEPFRSAGNSATRAEGLGLGLFIVNVIVRAHGGRVEIHSSAEAGTEFAIELPRRVSDHGDARIGTRFADRRE